MHSYRAVLCHVSHTCSSRQQEFNALFSVVRLGNDRTVVVGTLFFEVWNNSFNFSFVRVYPNSSLHLKPLRGLHSGLIFPDPFVILTCIVRKPPNYCFYNNLQLIVTGNESLQENLTDTWDRCSWHNVPRQTMTCLITGMQGIHGRDHSKSSVLLGTGNPGGVNDYLGKRLCVTPLSYHPLS